MITFLEYISEETKETSFKRLPNGLYVGYRVGRYLNGKSVSGADSRQSNDISKGSMISYKGRGVFLTNNVEHAMTYYGVHEEGENILQKVAFDIKDVTSGNMYNKEPEITVSKAIILASNVF